jgi:poly(hydroxyalkanoate) granule-associated protein
MANTRQSASKTESKKKAPAAKGARSKASIVSEQSAQLSEKIKESARQIWLAGLGAYTKAEEDTGKIFEKLVKEGEEIENLTRGVVEKQFKAVEDKVEGVREKASGTLNKLESVFDQRVSSALERLGIPSSSHVAELEKRIAVLEAKLAQKK